jgi:hypothetical protein
LIIPSWFYLALDLGQAHDPSAIVLVERRMRNAKTPVYLVRGALRLPLGMPYPEVVARVRKIVESYEVAGKCSVVVDATGVGAPVVDMLRAALTGMRHGNLEIMAVTMTAGERATEGRSSFGILRWNCVRRVSWSRSYWIYGRRPNRPGACGWARTAAASTTTWRLRWRWRVGEARRREELLAVAGGCRGFESARRGG